MNAPSVHALFTQFGIFHKDPNWRTTPHITGEINGLPSSRGTLILTNGVLCYLEQANGVFQGHLDWFVADKKEEALEVDNLKTKRSMRVDKKLAEACLDELIRMM